jgi:hypothetical protein
MNLKSFLAAAVAATFVGGAASALTIGVAVDAIGGSAVDTSSIDTGTARADLASEAGVAASDVIGYFIPLDDSCTFGVAGCGLSSDNGGGGALDMFIEFDPVVGGPTQIMSFWFEDLDLINSNDPNGFFETLDVFNTDDNSLIASFTTLGDNGISVVSGTGTDVILKAALGPLSAGTSLTAKLSFTSDFSGRTGPNTPEYLVATLEPIPLPAGIVLMGTALAGFGVMRRRKAKANA